MLRKNIIIKEGYIQSVSLALACSFLSLFFWFMPGEGSFLKKLEFSLKDMWIRLGASGYPDHVILVEVDEHSIKEQGPWPWSRDRYAAIVDYAAKSGARVVGLDLLLDIPKGSDRSLASVLGNTASVLAVYTPNIKGRRVKNYGIEVEHIRRPAPLLTNSAKGLGHVSLIYDSDGIIRRIPSFISDANFTFPAMSLVICALWQGLSQDEIVVSPGKIKVGKIDVPISGDGFFLIGYQGGPGIFPTVSATDILNGRVPPDVFKGKAVLFGVTAPGLADQWSTPFAPQGGMTGLEVVANATQAMLAGQVPAASNWQEMVVAVLAASFLGGLMGQSLSVRWTAFLLVSGPMALMMCGAAAFFLFNRFLVVTPACLSWSLTVAGVTILKAVGFQKKEQKHIVRLKKMAQMSSSGSAKDLCAMFTELTGVKGVIGVFRQGQKGVQIRISGQISEESASELLEAVKVYKDLDTLQSQWLSHKRHKWHCFEIASDSRLIGFFIIPVEDQIEIDLEEKELARSFSAHAAVLIERRLLIEELNENCQGTLEIVMSTLEKKAPGLITHSKQVAQIAKKIAQNIGINAEQLDIIYKAGMLHDIGLVGVPDYILTKQGALTPEERVWIESHPVIGSEMVEHVPQLKACAKIIRQHHERFDGKGYPDGLASDEICIGARILAVAEAFVTIVARRCEDLAKDPNVIIKEVMIELSRCSGTQFDPRVINVLLDIEGDIICE